MKKTLFLSLFFAGIILTACGNSAGESQSTQTGSDEITAITWDDSETDKNAKSDKNTIVIEDKTPSTESTVSDETAFTETVPEEAGEVTLCFAGDMDFDDRYTNMISLRSRANGILDCLSESLIERMRNADICMINNEFPYSNGGAPLENKKFTFRADPSTAEFLTLLGVDIVSLANNHAYDYGEEALIDTFDTLSSNGIEYVGAGHNISEAMTPKYFTMNGTKISIVAATQIERSLPPDTKEATESSAGVLRCQTADNLVSVINEAKENSDFCIAFVHWGSENVSEYEYSQTELATAFADAGADIIIGAHPHVLQGIEYINNVPVLYSLGNYWFNSKTMDNCLIELKLNNREIESLQFIPCRQHDCFTEEMIKGTTQDYERILSDMREYSADNVSIDDDGFISQK